MVFKKSTLSKISSLSKEAEALREKVEKANLPIVREEFVNTINGILIKKIESSSENEDKVVVFYEEIDQIDRNKPEEEKSITQHVIEKTGELGTDTIEKYDVIINRIKEELEKLTKSGILEKANVTKLWSLEEIIFAKNFKISSIGALKSILKRLEKFSNDKKYERLSKLIESALQTFPNGGKKDEEEQKQIDNKK